MVSGVTSRHGRVYKAARGDKQCETAHRPGAGVGPRDLTCRDSVRDAPCVRETAWLSRTTPKTDWGFGISGKLDSHPCHCFHVQVANVDLGVRVVHTPRASSSCLRTVAMVEIWTMSR